MSLLQHSTPKPADQPAAKRTAKPIAIITPWFAEHLKGGAEQQAWQVATRLSQRGHAVEVLTTCSGSFQDNWAQNTYKPGLTKLGNLSIRRFRVDRTDQGRFVQANTALLGVDRTQLRRGINPVSPADADAFSSENIRSDKLLQHLKANAAHYHAFIFLPYLYGPILNGLPLVAERAFLQPCLHDEAYAYLPEVAEIIHAAKGLLFISEGEARLAARLYGPGILPKSVVAGAGIEAGAHFDPNLIKVGGLDLSQTRYVLSLGRRDTTKNTDTLLRAYARFRQSQPNSPLQLLIAGPGDIPSDWLSPGVFDLGLVSEAEKEALLSHCQALFQASQNESYSRVIMEAWFYGRPAAAHQDCLATSLAVEEAQGGWLASSEVEWASLFAQVDQATPAELDAMGQTGQQYARDHANWDGIMARYESALGLVDPPLPSAPPAPRRGEIHQLLPGFAYGDAISNQALRIQRHLRAQGWISEIIAVNIDPTIQHLAQSFGLFKLNPSARLIYHHSIGCHCTQAAVAHPGPKCMVYHNITPAHFFEPYRPEIAALLDKGRQELADLAPAFAIAYGDSAYNAAELTALGFLQPEVLPITIDPALWDAPADPALMAQLQDGRTNLIFVGRMAPNKCQIDLVRAFAEYQTMDANARLILVGGVDTNDPYFHHLKRVIEELALTEDVLITGKVTTAALSAYYQTAALFWSMSEHEGFCVPLVEAMWFDVPILAYRSSAIPETLGAGGLMFNNKSDLSAVAALASVVVKDEALRRILLKAQRQRRTEFLPEIVLAKVDDLLAKFAYKSC